MESGEMYMNISFKGNCIYCNDDNCASQIARSFVNKAQSIMSLIYIEWKHVCAEKNNNDFISKLASWL